LNGRLPLFRGASVEQALSGGEDYELLFALPARRRVGATVAGLPVTEVGVCTPGRPGDVLFDGRPLAAAGWDPFRRSPR
jgi:thiamine-monophosphate kinase